MTIDGLIAMLNELKAHGATVEELVLAYDGDAEAVVPVTGYLIDVGKTLELCTDED